LYRPGGGATHPPSEELLKDHSYYIKMAGREVFKAAVLSMADACDHALQRARLDAGAIDLLIPHQANIRIIEATAKHAGMPMDKVYVNVDRFGNTSAASIAIALDEAVKTGRLKPGMVVMLCAFGPASLGQHGRAVVSTIWLCPGQARKKVGMGKDLAERFPAAREVFSAIDDALGLALSKLMFEARKRSSPRRRTPSPRFWRTARRCSRSSAKRPERSRAGGGGRALARRVLGLRHRDRADRARSGEAGAAARRADAEGR